MDNQKRTRSIEQNGAKRRKKRHSSRVLLYIMLTFLVTGVLMALSLTVWFPIKSVEVQGESPYSAEQILKAAQVPTGKNLFLTDLSGLEDKLRKTLPYIQTVTTKKHLNGQIVITVSPATPFAQMQVDGQWYLLDTDYRVLEYQGEEREDLLTLKGFRLTAQDVGSVLEFQDAEEKSALDQIVSTLGTGTMLEFTQIRLNGIYDIDLVYDNRILMEIGSCADLELKLQRGMRIVESMGNTTKEGVLNLTRLPSDERVYFTQKSIKETESTSEVATDALQTVITQEGT